VLSQRRQKMKKRTTTECLVRHIDISTEKNDIVDIKCGGPAYLGFDFYIDADIPPAKIKKFLENEFRKHGYSFTIYIPPKRYSKWVREDNLWSFERISGYLDKWYKND